MSDSIFSQIIKRQIPAHIEFEDQNFIVIHDIHPKAPVHVLIIPKKAYRSLEEVALDDDQFYIELLKLARQMAKQLKINDNYKLFMNVGKQVQDVQHLHLHLLGGWSQTKNILFSE